jgi:hypothetical protein
LTLLPSAVPSAPKERARVPMKKGDVLFRAVSSGDPDVWTAARERIARPDLAGADLPAAALADFDLADTDLSNADLSEADLTGAVLNDASLKGADLTGAKLLELETKGATFEGASLDEASVSGVFVHCNFAGSTWDGAQVRGARFVHCAFDEADIDVQQFSRGNRFEHCTFGDREDLPESMTSTRPTFLSPPVLDGERVIVSVLSLAYEGEERLKDEAIGAATGAGWEAEMVAILRDGKRIYVGLRPEPSVDELEEWIAFEPRNDEGLVAVELVIDPGFETFLEEVVVPMFEAAGADLAFTVEQDLEGGAVAVTEVAIKRGVAQAPKQYKRGGK